MHEFPNKLQHNNTRAASGLILFGLFLASVLANISVSLRHGRLSAPPLYDDVGYLVEAMQRLAFDPGQGLFSVLSSFLAAPPHAPLSTATGMLGFWLFGPNMVSPYLANSWILVVYILALLHSTRELDRPLTRTVIVACFLFVPASHALINEFRPDMAAGLVFAVTLSSLSSINLAQAPLWKKIALGVLAASVTYAKPSAIVVTIPVMALGAMLALLRCNLQSGVSLTEGLRASLPSLLAFAVLAIPFGIIWGEREVSYIYNVLVTDADIWGTPGTPLFHWAYHSFGAGGRLALGPFLFIGLFTILFELLLIWRQKIFRRRFDALSMMVFLAVIYFGLSMSSVKTVFVGSFFYFPFIIATVGSLGRLLNGAAIWGSYPGILPTYFAAVGLSCLMLWSPFSSTYTRPPANTSLASDAFSKAVSMVIEESKTIITTEACFSEKSVLVGINPLPFPVDGVTLGAAMHGIRLDTNWTEYSRTLDEALKIAHGARFVIAPDPKMPKLFKKLPGVPFMESIVASLERDSSYSREVLGEVNGFPIWIFIRQCKSANASSLR